MLCNSCSYYINIEAQAEMETHQLVVEAKIRKCSIQFGFVQAFWDSYSSIHSPLYFQENNFWFRLYFSI